MSTATLDAPTTLKAYLKPIDSEGLAAFAAKGCANPASRGTNVCVVSQAETSSPRPITKLAGTREKCFFANCFSAMCNLL